MVHTKASAKRSVMLLLAAAGLSLLPLAPAGASLTTPSSRHSAVLSERASVFLRATTSSAVTGDLVRFSGQAPSSWRSERVVIQVKVGPRKPWAKIGTVRVRPDGSYAFRQRMTGVGRQTYRVVRVAPSGKRAASPTTAVTVRTWYYLSSLTPIHQQLGETGSCTGGCTGFYPMAVTMGVCVLGALGGLVVARRRVVVRVPVRPDGSA